MQIAVWLRRKAGMHPALIFIVADVFHYDLADEIRRLLDFRIGHLLRSFLFGVMFL